MDALINPYTGDYVLLDGAHVRAAGHGLANAIYLRLKTRLGSWWRDPTLGSLLHTLQREKDVNRVSVLGKQYAENALKPILDDVRATKIEVTTDQPHDGRFYLLIEVTAASGEVQKFKHPVKVY